MGVRISLENLENVPLRKFYLIFSVGTIVVGSTFICRLLHQRQRLLLRKKVEAVEEKGSPMLIWWPRVCILLCLIQLCWYCWQISLCVAVFWPEQTFRPYLIWRIQIQIQWIHPFSVRIRIRESSESSFDVDSLAKPEVTSVSQT